MRRMRGCRQQAEGCRPCLCSTERREAQWVYAARFGLWPAAVHAPQNEVGGALQHAAYGLAVPRSVEGTHT